MKKNIVANFLYYTGISYLLFRICLLSTGIRVVNYHCTPEVFKSQFEKQLRFYKKYFKNIDLEGLNKFFSEMKSKSWLKSPSLIISFDDGLRSNFNNAVTLMEKYHFTGWFFVPTGFLLDPSKNFAINHSINIKQSYSDDRYGINLDEARYLADKHILGCHTFSHHRFSASDKPESLEYEISFAKKRMEELIGLNDISCFCWVGGEMQSYTAEAYRKIKASGYQYSFATITQPLNHKSDPFMIHRSNIESEYSISLVMFQLSGLMDLLYYRRRKKVIQSLR